MKVTIAKTAGFCMGVRRAVEMSLDASNSGEVPICSYGPLIHNPQVLKLLEEKGISVIKEIPETGTGTAIIRAHGVPPTTQKELSEAGFTVKDATCPRVIKVQTIIRKHTSKGYAAIIIGDEDHPEVIGLLGYAENNGYVVNSIKELDALPGFENAIIVAQTTQNTLFFSKVKLWAEEKFPHYKIFDTICGSTERRQKEVYRLAESVDAMIVVGGRTSGNTQRLAEVAKNAGKTVFHIEEESELDLSDLASSRSIGITAGASTPNWIINRVYRKLELFKYGNGDGWRNIIFPIQKMLIQTNLYIALGAGCLTYACTALQGIGNPFSHILIALFYVLSMHTISHLIGKQSDQYNDPDRASFYDRNKNKLALMAILSGVVGLATAYTMGIAPLLIFLVMSIMGLFNNLKFVPGNLKLFGYQRIRDIPGSKTILTVLGWGVVTSVFPALTGPNRLTLGTVIVFLWAIGTVLVRTAFFDILDMQGDRIVGTKTIPILIGEDKTKQVLKYVLVISFFLLFCTGIMGLVSFLGVFLSIIPVIMSIVILTHERGIALQGFRPVFWVESNFILIGIITYLYRHSF